MKEEDSRRPKGQSWGQHEEASGGRHVFTRTGVERGFTSDSPMLGDTYWLCDLGPVILPQGALLLLSLSGDNPT